MANSIKFDSVELLNTTYIPQFAKHETGAEVDLETVRLPREDGLLLVSAQRGKKVIQLKGVLVGTSRDDLDSKIDVFKELLSRQEKNLEISFNATTRRYVATCVKHEFDRDFFNVSFVPWTAEFVVLSGVGYTAGASYSALQVNPAIDSGSGYAGTAAVVYGSSPPKASVTVTVHTSDWVTSKGVMIKNVDTGEKIIVTIPSTWGVGEALNVDCAAKRVTATVVSSLAPEVPFYGVFPSLAIGNNSYLVKCNEIPIQELVYDSLSLFSTSWDTSSTNRRIAQSFEIPYTDATVKSLAFMLTKTGSPASLEFRIETDNNNKPSGTLADAAATVTTSPSATGTKQMLTVRFASAFQLTGRTKYWLVVKPSAGNDGSNYYSFLYSADSARGQYPLGNISISTNSGSNYSDYPTDDLAFQVHVGGTQEDALFRLDVDYTPTFL